MFLCLKYLICSIEVLLDIYQEYVSQIQGFIDGKYIVKISRGIVFNMSSRSYCIMPGSFPRTPPPRPETGFILLE